MTQADVLPALDRHEHTRPAFNRARAGLGHGRRWIGFYPVDLFWFLDRLDLGDVDDYGLVV
jgi:hypothetical protein